MAVIERHHSYGQSRRLRVAKQWTWLRLAPVLILIVGAFLRLQGLSAIEFNIDQVYPQWQALRSLQAGDFPLAGQGTSVLFANPTLMGYFFVPFLAFAPTPYTPFIFTILLNTIALWLAYRALKRMLGFEIALIAMTLLAVNPWLIEDSRRTWVQSLFPFFVALIFWSLTLVLLRLTHRPARWMLITATAAALFANTYLLAYFIVVPVALLVMLFWRKLPKRALFAGVGIFALFFAFYAMGLLNQWEDTRTKADTFLNEGESRLSGEALGHALRLVTGWEYAHARGTDAPADDEALRIELSAILHLLWAAALVAGMLSAAVQWWRGGGRRPVATILLIWFWVPVFAMSYVSRDVHPFYLIFTIPAGQGLAAWGVSPVLRWRVGRGALLGVLFFTAGLNGVNTIRFAQESAAHPGQHLPFTLPLGEATRLGQALDAAYQDGMRVYTPMDEWTPMVLAGEIFPVVGKNPLQEMMIIPPDGGLYMTFHAPDESLDPPIHGRPVDIPLRFEDGTRAVIWRAAQDFSPRNVFDYGSDIGLRFYGWHLLDALDAGEGAALRTYWRVDGLAPERFSWAFAPFVHVYDGTGKRIAIIDGQVAPMGTWQIGDWMVQEMVIVLPVDATPPYRLDVGFFDSVRMVNAIFTYPQDGETIFTATITIVE